MGIRVLPGSVDLATRDADGGDIPLTPLHLGASVQIEGMPMTTTSAQSAASLKSVVARKVSESSTSSPRYCELRWLVLMSSAVSWERTHCRVGPRREQMDATVVPQEPPPSTTTLGSRRSGVMGFRVMAGVGCSRGVWRGGFRPGIFRPCALFKTRPRGWFALRRPGAKSHWIGPYRAILRLLAREVPRLPTPQPSTTTTEPSASSPARGRSLPASRATSPSPAAE